MLVRKKKQRFGVTNWAAGWRMSEPVFAALEKLAQRRTSSKSALIREALVAFLVREGMLRDENVAA